MLVSKRDWCHEVRLLAPTPKGAEIQALTRRRDDRTKFSFMALTPLPLGEGDSTLVESGEGPPADGPAKVRPSPHLSGRLVSDALNSKGKMERWLCTTGGQLVQLRLLDRQCTPNNELLATAERGMIVNIAGVSSLPRITEEATVRSVS